MVDTAQKYFQSKCSMCNNYEQITAHPTASSDAINCPVGGEVTVASGCDKFSASPIAACGTCWNFSDDAKTGSCSVHGILAKLREACPDAVERAQV